jgi:hypothetical protein
MRRAHVLIQLHPTACTICARAVFSQAHAARVHMQVHRLTPLAGRHDPELDSGFLNSLIYVRRASPVLRSFLGPIQQTSAGFEAPSTQTCKPRL